MSADMDAAAGKCELCGCVAPLTRHHLRPQVKCKNKYKALRNDDSNVAMLCRPCHDAVHAAHSENELRDLYDTVVKLKTSEEVMRFVEWRRKHPDFDGHAKMCNGRKRRR